MRRLQGGAVLHYYSNTFTNAFWIPAFIYATEASKLIMVQALHLESGKPIKT